MCLVFALTPCLVLVGCADDSGNKISDSGYINYLQYQIQYDRDKELLPMLKSYGVSVDNFSANKDLTAVYADVGIDFVFEDKTIFTHNDLISVTQEENYILLKLNANASKPLLNATLSYYATNINIFRVADGERVFLASPRIANSGNSFHFYISFIKTDADMRNMFLAICARVAVKTAAEEYNAKIKLNKYAVSYLPNSLPMPPKLLDVAPYLERAKNFGFEV